MVRKRRKPRPAPESRYVLPTKVEELESLRPQFPAPRAASVPEVEHIARAPIDPRVNAYNERMTAIAVAVVQQSVSPSHRK
jgi:hypothetical protein